MAYAHRGSWMGGDNRGRIVDPWTDLTPGEESRRYQNVPSQQSYTTTVTPDTAQDLGYVNSLAQMLGNLDDRVQGAIRRSVYGQRDDGTYGNPIGGAMGQVFHMPRQEYLKENNLGYLLGSRALQAGAVTAAGAGLIDLTHRFANQFGGPADEQQIQLY